MDPRVMELRIKKWIPVIEDQAKSGMSKKEWCAMHGINCTSFFRWQKRVRSTSLINVRLSPHSTHHLSHLIMKCVLLNFPSAQDSPAEMAGQRCRETIRACGTCPSISIRCGGFTTDFNDGVDEKQLSVVLRVLKYAD